MLQSEIESGDGSFLGGGGSKGGKKSGLEEEI
jgi:hypothetical protein